MGVVKLITFIRTPQDIVTLEQKEVVRLHDDGHELKLVLNHIHALCRCTISKFTWSPGVGVHKQSSKHSVLSIKLKVCRALKVCEA